MTKSSKSNYLHHDAKCPRFVSRLGRFLWLIILLVNAPFTTAQTLSDPMFAEAMKHIENGRWPEAKALLNYQLSKNPDLHRARVELALVYMQLEAPEQSKYHFDYVLKADNIPENVRQNILQLRAQLNEMPNTQSKTDLKAPHQASTSLQVSFGYDDNVRFSTGDYFLGDDPFLDGEFFLTDDGSFVYVAPDGYVYDALGNRLFKNDGFYELDRPSYESAFIESKIGLNHSYRFDSTRKLSWHNQFTIQSKENSNFSDFNRLQLKLQTGLNWQVREQLKASVSLSHRLLMRNGNVQVRATSFKPELTHFSNWGSWTFGLDWTKRTFEETSLGDGALFFPTEDMTKKVISAKWSNLFWDSNVLLLAKIEYIDNNASEQFDYRGSNFTAAIVVDMTEKLTWSFTTKYFYQSYNEFDETDETRTFNTKLNYVFNDNLDVFISAERAIRSSEIFGGIDSDKSIVQLGFKLTF